MRGRYCNTATKLSGSILTTPRGEHSDDPVTEVQRGKFVSLGSYSKEKLDPNKCWPVLRVPGALKVWIFEGHRQARRWGLYSFPITEDVRLRVKKEHITNWGDSRVGTDTYVCVCVWFFCFCPLLHSGKDQTQDLKLARQQLYLWVKTNPQCVYFWGKISCGKAGTELCVAENNLEFLILLPVLTKYWGDRCVPHYAWCLVCNPL